MMKPGFSIDITCNTVEITTIPETGTDYFEVKNEKLHLAFFGILLNKKQLLQHSNESILKDFFVKKYEDVGVAVFPLLEGEFRGFIFDKRENKIFVFTNITATQKVFYGKINSQIFIDTSLLRLSQAMRKNKIIPSPNLQSIYQLLCFGGLLENGTQINEVYRILDGHFLDIDTESIIIKENKYTDIYDLPYFSGSKADAYAEIHEIFASAVKLEYEKDGELGKKSLALLSGGLDSRVAMLYAVKQKAKPDLAFCFSQSKYYDETISRKIAKDHGLQYEFVPLDGGNFLEKIDELTAISEGAVFFTGGIHVNYAIKELQFQDFGLFHSGQIGDGVLGGFNSKPHKKKPGNFKIVINPFFLPKVEEELQKHQKNFEKEETFLLRNLVFNQTVLGAQVFQQKAYQTSPFMHTKLMQLAISLPEKWKYKQRFYIEWISKYCPEATKFQWERTLLKPNAAWKTNFGDKVVKRGFNIIHQKILKTPASASMYPYQFYYDSSSTLQIVYNSYFSDNINRLDQYPELKKEVEILFREKNFFRKTQAINVLSIFKLFFQ